MAINCFVLVSSLGLRLEVKHINDITRMVEEIENGGINNNSNNNNNRYF